MDRRSGRLQNILNRIKIRLLSVPRAEMPQACYSSLLFCCKRLETASGKGEKRRRNAQRNGALLLQKRVLYTEAGCKDNPIRIFSEEELRKATNNYDLDRHIGRIELLYYFKGTIDDGHEVAVKRSRETIDSIVTEIVILSTINHKNIAKLLGCSLETERPVLVYEFYSNGSLTNNIQKLSWSDRLRIATEVAEALNYLHTHLSMVIVHRDIKSHNIMLDDHCTAKIIGFHFLFTITSDNILRDDDVAGTLMYLEPEYMQTGVVSEKMDVYSFGVVMLELLTGERAYQLRVFLRKVDLIGKFVDELSAQLISSSINLGGSTSTSPAAAAPETSAAGIIASTVVEEGRPEQIQAFAQVAMNCLRERGKRPTMKEVALELWRIRSQEGAAVAG